MILEISKLNNSNIWKLFQMRESIQIDPFYQRASDIWTLDNRQLLLDTILNSFDVPKLYLHKFKKPLKKGGRKYDYAIIDGRQRLESIWSFIDGKIALDDDFVYFHDKSIKAGGMKYEELGKAYPNLKVCFDSFPLAVICIETEEIEVIEEMFSRLNEAVPLTAAEKRNAWPGPMPGAIQDLAKASFFTTALPFTNKRYRHYDLATKFLYAEREGKVVDTKKTYLDRFVQEFAKQPKKTKRPTFFRKAKSTLARMSKVFTKDDVLLRQVGMVTVYHHLFRLAHEQGWGSQITRRRLLDFEKLREHNRIKAEKDLPQADYMLIEFEKYAQSPNDSYAIKIRLKVMLEKAFNRQIDTDSL